MNRLTSKFRRVKIVQITQGQNRYADSLAMLTSLLADEIPQLIKVEVVHDPSIDSKVGVSTVSSLESSCMDSIIQFLADDRLPSESKEAYRVRRIVAWFCLSKDRRLY